MRTVAACLTAALVLGWPAGHLVAASPAGSPTNAASSRGDRDAAPDLPFRDVNGRDHRLSEFRGKVVLLVFWAAWCPACLVELPEVDRLQASFGGDDFVVLALAQQSGDPKSVGEVLRRRGLPHLDTWVDADRRLGHAFAQTHFPTALLLDRRGREVKRVVGVGWWGSPQGEAFIRRAIHTAGGRDRSDSLF